MGARRHHAMMEMAFPLLMVFMMSFDMAAAGVTGTSVQGMKLPEPPASGAMSLKETLAQRRSVRDFSSEALTLPEISQLLWAAQGVTAPERRTAPSAGATYPLEIYLAAGKVDELAAGIYRYRPEGHHLEAMADGDIRLSLATAAANQEWLSSAAMVVVITAIFERTTARYGKRGERYVQMESGHVAQNLLLQATAIGLGATPVGAFNDIQISRLLHLPAGKTPLLLIPVGRGIE